MKTKHFVLAFIFLFNISINSQEIDQNSSEKPVSIYTFSNFSNGKNNFSAINKKLKLANLNFVFVDGVAMDLNQFSVDFTNLGKTPTAFIYDDYKRYQDQNLLKGFLLKNDPTRWNLQCLPPNLQP
ncbi:hypothetical protein [Polaribacter glomeratus]|uniref:Uncharacterized protein n=1 Tax=Polaribacter glomeratus TaxID=102 RepID=A0A2S7WHJ7_9FLAO|nr:hypothetical protein [Polaribacter glomeratus]PQJ77080.1 hypothetical protein BTO16_14610 [Polaribacter glomeratus]TXD67071.1 hypothetical protein ESX12_00310 [Polaribacter glomeratus]